MIGLREDRADERRIGSRAPCGHRREEIARLARPPRLERGTRGFVMQRVDARSRWRAGHYYCSQGRCDQL